MPLSRNRTPSHQDLSELHEGAFCADGSTEDVHYVIIARAASSSTSACFAAHFLCTVLDAVEEWHGRRSSEGGGVATGVKAARTASGSSSHETLDISVVDNLCRWAAPPVMVCVLYGERVFPCMCKSPIKLGVRNVAMPMHEEIKSWLDAEAVSSGWWCAGCWIEVQTAGNKWIMRSGS